MTVKPKRRLLRFSLRAMLVVLTVFGVWLGVQVNRAANQRAVVRWVTENGGRVGYDWQSDVYDINSNDETEPPGPDWLRQQIGDVYFQTVVTVIVGNKDLSPLAKLSNLEHLKITYPRGSNLSPLANLTKLQWLDLGGNQISDISALARLTKLEFLNLSSTQVSDLSPLAKLSNLEWLILDDTKVNNVTPLESLTRLEKLYIRDAAVTNEQISKLQIALPNCLIWH
jgi:hypothetical protein